jgi:hypothetical protein
MKIRQDYWNPRQNQHTKQNKCIVNNYSTTLREPGEVFVNDYDEFNQSEFGMLATPVISNTEI